MENIIDNLKKIGNIKERIIGREKYRNSAVLICLVEFDAELCILFEKRAKNISQEGEICLPGGKISAEDNSLFETVLRETEEELGIDSNRIDILDYFGTLISGTGAAVDVVVGKIDAFDKQEIFLNPAEVEKLLIIPIDLFSEKKPQIHFLSPLFDSNANKLPAKEMGLPQKYHLQWHGHPIEIYFYKYNCDVIWGITAEIIFDFINITRKAK